MVSFIGKTFGHIYHARYGKVLVVAFLLALVATATATVYVFYYTAGTATVQAADVKFVAGPDVSGSCSAYPCASGSVDSTGDVLTATISFFPANTGASPIPATYYSNFAQLHNSGSGAHSIKSVEVINVGGTTADLGGIVVYYCTSQTEFSASGSPVSACVGSFTISSGSGGSLTGTYPQTIAASATQYIEIAAYAASSATTGSVTFQIAVQWV
ncbi:MAG: hypothetical protein JRN06_03110 [Nitrososphaerota archaeon]|nr:hypothetical protein [Nitrososphaerota archaeon]MDG7023152.1 hypothetical protein [Nitrososphaerota archaeon]